MLYSIKSSQLIVPCVSSISHHALQKPFDYKVKKCLPNVKFINESETKILSHSFKCIM